MKWKSEKKRGREGQLKTKKRNIMLKNSGRMQRQALSGWTARVQDNRKCQYQRKGWTGERNIVWKERARLFSLLERFNQVHISAVNHKVPPLVCRSQKWSCAAQTAAIWEGKNIILKSKQIHSLCRLCLQYVLIMDLYVSFSSRLALFKGIV